MRNQGNIAVRGKYGKDKSRELLYCRTCSQRFAATQAIDAPTRLLIRLLDRWARIGRVVRFAIVVACYNLIRPHGTLSRGQDRIFRPKTPAMAAKVTDHPWTFMELLMHPVLCQ